MANVLAANELRKGVVYIEDKDILKVLDYKHQKYGRGQATIRVKVKNIKNGVIAERTYDTGVKLEEADISRRNAQFLYSDETNAYFMDNNDYSQFQVLKEDVADELLYLVEGGIVQVIYIGDDPISVELNKTVELKVVEAMDATAGDTATNAYKEVTLETGLKLLVPMFIKRGDVLKINTDESSYIERV